MRIVRPTSSTRHLLLIPEDDEKLNPEDYLGARFVSKSKTLRVEDNLTNRIILDYNVPTYPMMPLATIDERDLMPFQVNDVSKLVGLPNGLNLNPMGLGKTIETIVTMKTLAVRNGVIIVPKATIAQWLVQCREWWPDYQGQFVEYVSKKTAVTADNIYILNYEKFLNVTTERLFRSFIWDWVSVDEIHKLKNPKAKTTQAIRMLPRTRFYGKTGSPILNKPNDLWSLLYLCDPFYSGSSYWSFVDYYCYVEETEFGKVPRGLTKIDSHVEILNRLLELVSVRNAVSVAPPKTVTLIPLEMEAKQKALYKKAKNLALDELPENLTILNALSLGTRLQQITSWPGLFDGYEKTVGIKFEWIAGLLENNPEERLVVFTKFSQTAIALRDYLNGTKVTKNALAYHGQLSNSQRNEVLRKFCKDKVSNVLIGTIGSLGVGVDGLQEVCRTAIFLERDWSPAINKQCEGRLERKGQNNPVMCYYLECKKSWDQYVGRVNINKSEDIRRALNDEH